MAKKYYLIGIGGISMSSLAVFLKINSDEVSGSDLIESENLKLINQFNIKYYLSHKADNIKEFNPDFVVINYAINSENEELKWAIENKKKIFSRAEILGKISKKFKNVIAISGTHGKTTTTAMLSEIFISAGLKPTVHVGGIMKLNNSNFLIGKKKFFITEACEYKNSFLNLNPDLGAVLNIEPDHLDFFKNFDEINSSFNKFLEKSKIKVFWNQDKLILDKSGNIFVYQTTNIRINNNGYSFNLLENEKLLSKFQTNFLGEHNIKNAVVAIVIAKNYGINLKVIRKCIGQYHGVKRRFEKVGKINNTIIISDYAHHPTEITKTIAQAKHYGKVLVVFQPHTYSRTQKLFNLFTDAFDKANGLIIFKTYPAREDESAGLSALDLFSNIKENKDLFSYLDYSDNFEDAKQKILSNLNNFNCVLILGAGDIENLSKSVIN